jgi:hypothetical protein
MSGKQSNLLSYFSKSKTPSSTPSTPAKKTDEKEDKSVASKYPFSHAIKLICIGDPLDLTLDIIYVETANHVVIWDWNDGDCIGGSLQ